MLLFIIFKIHHYMNLTDLVAFSSFQKLRHTLEIAHDLSPACPPLHLGISLFGWTV